MAVGRMCGSGKTGEESSDPIGDAAGLFSAGLGSQMLAGGMGALLGCPAGIAATQLQRLYLLCSADVQGYSDAAALAGDDRQIEGSGGRTPNPVGAVVRRKPGLGVVGVNDWEPGWMLVYLLAEPGSRHQSHRRSAALKVKPVGWVLTVLCLGAL